MCIICDINNKYNASLLSVNISKQSNSRIPPNKEKYYEEIKDIKELILCSHVLEIPSLKNLETLAACQITSSYFILTPHIK